MIAVAYDKKRSDVSVTVYSLILILPIVELVLPFLPFLVYFKYLILGVGILYAISSRLSTLSITLAITLFGTSLLYYIFFGYQISAHYIFLQGIFIFFLQYGHNFNSRQQLIICRRVSNTVIFLALAKITLALGISLGFQSSILNSLFEVYGGGVIDVYGIAIPRLTFGPEFIFLVTYFTVRIARKSNVLFVSILLSMSRVYIPLMIICMMLMKQYRKLFVSILLFATLVFFSNISEIRDLNSGDVRLLQWTVFYEVFSNNILLGSPSIYISELMPHLFEMGYSSLKVECESCQLLSDLGLIVFLLTFLSPLCVASMGFSSKKSFKKFIFIYTLLFLAAFFNPVFVTFGYVSIMLYCFMIINLQDSAPTLHLEL